MGFSNDLKIKILDGYSIKGEDALKLVDENLEELCKNAYELQKHFCGNGFDICTIINGKSGKCSEDCKYCAQSVYCKLSSAEYPLVNREILTKDALYNHDKNIKRYSVVTSGRALSEAEVDEICESYKSIKKSCDISLCASHGLLTPGQFKKLKEAGVTRYHNNLETSRRYFPKICTTHTYDDKITTIKNAMEAGLEVCSGGIMGLGETMEDRIDMVLDIRSLGVNSIPVNILNPIKGTEFENLPTLSNDLIRRIIAIFRFIMPSVAIKLAGGRSLMNDMGKALFLGGSNGAISGDMLTTSGITIDLDMEMINDLGMVVKRIE